VSYSDNLFKLYERKRLDDLKESIETKGIIVPIIVRPVNGEKSIFEILSGHNRVNTAKELGKDKVPAIIREGIGDDLARLNVTESYLI